MRPYYLTDPRSREILIGAALSTAAPAHNLTLIPTGSGVIDLERLAVAGFDDTAQGSTNGAGALFVESASWASDERIFNAAGFGGSNPYDPMRGEIRRVPYGLRQISGNNAIAVNVSTQGQNFAASIAVPAFRGDNCDEPPAKDARPYWLGCDAATIAAVQLAAAGPGASATIQLEAVNDCVVDLDTLSIEATRTTYTVPDTIDPDLVPGFAVTGLVLPDGRPLIIPDLTSGTVAVPGSLWCPCRTTNWVRFGWVKMSAGQVIKLGVTNLSGYAATVAPGVVAYDSGSCRSKVAIPPTKCKV